MSRILVLLLVHVWAVNPSRCILCLYASFFYLFYFTVVRLSAFCVFISLCASFVALALVFLPEFYSTAYRTPFLSWPVDEDVFLALRVLGGNLLVVFFCFRIYLCFSFLCIYLHYFVCLLCPFLATMSFAGYFPVCILLSAFPAFFLQTCPTVFWLDEKIIVFFQSEARNLTY